MSTLFEFLPIGAYRTDASGMLLRANAALVRIDGFDTEEELLATFNDDATEWYVDPDRRSQFR